MVVSRAEYERLTGPKQDMVTFFRNSPLAEAIRDGLLTPEDLCPPRDGESSHRDLDFSESNA